MKTVTDDKILNADFYFQDKDFSLHKGDCINILDSMPENSVDMVFADPPYMLSNGGITCQAGKMVSVNKGEWDKSGGLKADYEFHKKWLASVKRILKPDGTIWISGTYHSIYMCGFILQMLKYHLLNDICWYKKNASPNLSCRFFTASHETLIWARKDKQAKHYFNYELMKHGDWAEDFLKKPNLQMRSVWAVYPPKDEEKKFGKHPTQKPIELLKRIILASSKEDALIVDPFAGSGTTGITAKMLKRRFIGIDIEEKYLKLTVNRYLDLVNNEGFL